MFSIEEMELTPMAEETYGMFFGGDSYVIKYTYEKEGREQYIIYFWQVCVLVVRCRWYGRRLRLISTLVISNYPTRRLRLT